MPRNRSYVGSSYESELISGLESKAKQEAASAKEARQMEKDNFDRFDANRRFELDSRVKNLQALESEINIKKELADVSLRESVARETQGFFTDLANVDPNSMNFNRDLASIMSKYPALYSASKTEGTPIFEVLKPRLEINKNAVDSALDYSKKYGVNVPIGPDGRLDFAGADKLRVAREIEVQRQKIDAGLVTSGNTNLLPTGGTIDKDGNVTYTLGTPKVDNPNWVSPEDRRKAFVSKIEYNASKIKELDPKNKDHKAQIDALQKENDDISKEFINIGNQAAPGTVTTQEKVVRDFTK